MYIHFYVLTEWFKVDKEAACHICSFYLHTILAFSHRLAYPFITPATSLYLFFTVKPLHCIKQNVEGQGKEESMAKWFAVKPKACLSFPFGGTSCANFSSSRAYEPVCIFWRSGSPYESNASIRAHGEWSLF